MVCVCDLAPAMVGVDFKAIILEYCGPGSAEIHKFIIADHTGSIILWLWGDMAAYFSPMQIVQLSGAFTRVYRNSLSVYLKKEGGRIVRTGMFRMLFSRSPDMSKTCKKIPPVSGKFENSTNIQKLEQPPTTGISDAELKEWRRIAEKIASGHVPPENRGKLVQLLEGFVSQTIGNPIKMADEKISQVVAAISESLRVFQRHAQVDAYSQLLHPRLYVVIDQASIPEIVSPAPLEKEINRHKTQVSRASSSKIKRSYTTSAQSLVVTKFPRTNWNRQRSTAAVRPSQISYGDLSETPAGDVSDDSN